MEAFGKLSILSLRAPQLEMIDFLNGTLKEMKHSEPGLGAHQLEMVHFLNGTAKKMKHSEPGSSSARNGRFY